MNHSPAHNKAVWRNVGCRPAETLFVILKFLPHTNCSELCTAPSRRVLPVSLGR